MAAKQLVTRRGLAHPRASRKTSTENHEALLPPAASDRDALTPFAAAARAAGKALCRELYLGQGQGLQPAPGPSIARTGARRWRCPCSSASVNQVV
jgi:hypothetical protein